MKHITSHLEVRIEFILAMLLFAVFVVLSLDGYIRYIEKQATPSAIELTEENEELFHRVADYAELRRDIKEEYLRCRNLISEGGTEFDVNYCYDFVEWTSTLQTPVF